MSAMKNQEPTKQFQPADYSVIEQYLWHNFAVRLDSSLVIF